jgi:hypothetical protein
VSADYYILDARSCVGNCALWWGKDRKGYTCNLDDAGLYTLDQALSERPTDVPVHRDVARANVTTHVRWDRLADAGVGFREHSRPAYLAGLREGST